MFGQKKRRKEIEKINGYGITSLKESSMKTFLWFIVYISALLTFFVLCTLIIFPLFTANLIGSTIIIALFFLVFITWFLGAVKNGQAMKEFKVSLNILKMTETLKDVGKKVVSKGGEVKKNFESLEKEVMAISKKVSFIGANFWWMFFFPVVWTVMLVQIARKMILVCMTLDEIAYDVGVVSKKEAEEKKKKTVETKPEERNLQAEEEQMIEQEKQERMRLVLEREAQEKEVEERAADEVAAKEDEWQSRAIQSVEEIQAEQAGFNGYQMEQDWGGQKRETSDANRGVSESVRNYYRQSASEGNSGGDGGDGVDKQLLQARAGVEGAETEESLRKNRGEQDKAMDQARAGVEGAETEDSLRRNGGDE